MADDPAFDVKAFGSSFQGFMQSIAQQTPDTEGEVLALLREHLQADPAEMSVVAERVKPHDHPNLQRALDAWVAGEGRRIEVRGLALPGHARYGLNLASLTRPEDNGAFGSRGTKLGPVQYRNLNLAGDERLECIQLGLLLLRDGKHRLVVLLNAPDGHSYMPEIALEVLATTQEAARSFLAELHQSMRARNVYRGHIVSLESAGDHVGTLEVSFHDIPEISRDDIILPEGLLDRLERHTTGFARHRDRLKGAGLHLKRGMLLHGPPGTGKTLSTMYLVGQMRERTTLLVTGRAIRLVAESCALARLLQPATLIIEDVDLIAEDRRTSHGHTSLLFDLMNQMDGFAEDADVLFVLTTNRPEILEPALAARPGRIDVNLEVPLPDADCRRRLLNLYAKGLELRLDDLDLLVRRTQGVSAAFLRELVRKSALLAAEDAAGDDFAVTDQHFRDALQDMLGGGQISRSLLGFRSTDSDADAPR